MCACPLYLSADCYCPFKSWWQYHLHQSYPWPYLLGPSPSPPHSQRPSVTSSLTRQSSLKAGRFYSFLYIQHLAQSLPHRSETKFCWINKRIKKEYNQIKYFRSHKIWVWILTISSFVTEKVIYTLLSLFLKIFICPYNGELWV